MFKRAAVWAVIILYFGAIAFALLLAIAHAYYRVPR